MRKSVKNVLRNLGCAVVLTTLLYNYSAIVISTLNTTPHSNSRSIQAGKSCIVPNDTTRQVTNRSPTIVNNDTDVTFRQTSLKMKTGMFSSEIASNKTNRPFYPVTRYATYLIENPFLCSSEQNLSILVIVHTAPGNFDRRNTIRSTWTNATYTNHLGRLRVLFLLGRVGNESMQQDIEKEFIKHGDLLQGDFIDAYRNLTHKGVMAYKWLTERCRNAKLILKVDDDVVMNTYDIWTKYYPIYHHESKQILCRFNPRSEVHRKNTSKWYVTDKEFSGKFYPPYCRGFMVLLNNDLIPTLYRAALVTPFFWVDDVYLYGMLPDKVQGIKFNTYHNFTLSSMRAIDCYKTKRSCNLLAAGAYDTVTADMIWAYMTKAYKSSQSS